MLDSDVKLDSEQESKANLNRVTQWTQGGMLLRKGGPILVRADNTHTLIGWDNDRLPKRATAVIQAAEVYRQRFG